MALRSLNTKNRLWFAPMCQFSAEEGMPNEWHRVHYGARAIGGFGLITVESTAVAPEGRISPNCLGLWNDEQAAAWKPITDFVHSQGVKLAVQLNHAGRKGSRTPQLPDQPKYDNLTVPAESGGWETMGPSPIPAANQDAPREMTRDEIRNIPSQFATAAKRAVDAGFDAIEIQAAHGYLLHQFLSPLSNKRTDSWGGSFDNRTRLVPLVVTAVRAAIGEEIPIFVRLSATDWIGTEPSWDLEQTIRLVQVLGRSGVDLISVTTGGNAMADIPFGPNYQVKFADEISRATGVPVSVAGLVTEPVQAEAIIAEGRADVMLIGREALRDPNFAHRAAHELGVGTDVTNYPKQYARGPF